MNTNMTGSICVLRPCALVESSLSIGRVNSLMSGSMIYLTVTMVLRKILQNF